MSTTILFYVFIFISIVLIIGYFYGKKKNQHISANAINTLENLVEPEDQVITNIGGVVGYHLEMDFETDRNIERIEGTITLMPRHSLLYLPISKIFRKFDRCYLNFNLKKITIDDEVHFLEKNFLDKHREGIKNHNDLKSKEVKIGKKNFCYYYKNHRDLAQIEKIIEKIGGKEYLKELSIDFEGLIECLYVPTIENNKKILEPIINWLQY